MSILVDKESRVVVQGVTGKEGSFHTRQMLEYGTKVVAGVTPGKAGQQVEGVPVYHTVMEALAEQGANVSIIFVPAGFCSRRHYGGRSRGHQGHSLHHRRAAHPGYGPGETLSEETGRRC